MSTATLANDFSRWAGLRSQTECAVFSPRGEEARAATDTALNLSPAHRPLAAVRGRLRRTAVRSPARRPALYMLWPVGSDDPGSEAATPVRFDRTPHGSLANPHPSQLDDGGPTASRILLDSKLCDEPHRRSHQIPPFFSTATPV